MSGADLHSYVVAWWDLYEAGTIVQHFDADLWRGRLVLRGALLDADFTPADGTEGGNG